MVAVREEAPLRSGLLAADLKRIERLYVARGYYQAEVVSDEVKQKPPDGVALSAQISEGPPTHIGQVTIEGMEPVPADVRAKVLDELPLRTGQALHRSTTGRRPRTSSASG